MKTPTNRKELETALRRAFEIDRMLPKVAPKVPTSLIGQMIVIPDDERSIQDMQEEYEKARERLTVEDMELWESANKWMQTIHGIRWAVVKKRCQGMGWNRISRMLKKEGVIDLELHRTTLWRYFVEGLNEILQQI